MATDREKLVLIVEDDAPLAARLAQGLREAGHVCRVAGSVREAEAALDEIRPSIVLLDMGLPDGDGLDLLRSIRRRHAALPVIITTARGEVADRVGGLENGADDYLVKPYAFEELLARIRTQLRHIVRFRSQMAVGDLSVDLTTRTATRAGALLDLTPREFDLLTYLCSLDGSVATRQMIQQNVWNVRSSMASMDNVLDVHVSRLRQKLEKPGLPPLLHTVRGVGLVLREPDA